MSNWTTLIQQLHQTNHRLVLSVTGGGSSAISRLLSVPGASNTILEANVPYSQAALTAWLSTAPESFCSRETALSMATVAWCRATQLNSDPTANPIGVGCTASLVSSKPKRGEHRCWVAVQSNNSTFAYSLVLDKGRRDRAAEEAVVADLILQAVLEVTGIKTDANLNSLSDAPTGARVADSKRNQNTDETVVVESEIAAPEIADVVNRRAHLVWSLPDGSFAKDVARPKGILSGAFNPLHHGHSALADAAATLLGGDVYFELPIRNADKPPLDYFAIEDRRRQFKTRPVALTTSPLFVHKAELFPNTTFVIGIDTAVRILDERFYNASADQMREALRVIYRFGCRFLVAGRLSTAGWLALDNVPAANEFGDLFTAIPTETFREDVSSTELRQSKSNRHSAGFASGR